MSLHTSKPRPEPESASDSTEKASCVPEVIERRVVLPNEQPVLTGRNQYLSDCIQDSVSWERALLQGAHPEYLKGLRAHEMPVLPPAPESVITAVGYVSTSKSSFLNAMCKYPILPTARQTTSTCAVEIRRAYGRSAERLEVCLLSANKGCLEKEAKRIFRQQRLSDTLFGELLDYAEMLTPILKLESLDFFRDEAGKTVLSPDNWRHCVMLLMVLLDTYVYQYSPGINEDAQRINAVRDGLFQKLDIPTGVDYGLRLYWDSERIPSNSVVVDLPGTGAAAVGNNGQIGHTALVQNYIDHAAALLFLIQDSGTIGPEEKAVLDMFLVSERMNAKSTTRVTFFMGKADSSDDATLQASIKSFRTNYQENIPSYADYPLYTFSAWGEEWLYQESGIPLDNLNLSREMKRKLGGFLMPGQLEMYVKSIYERKFPYQIKEGGGFGAVSTSEIFQTFLLDRTEHIQFLTLLENMRHHLLDLRSVAGIIDSQYNLLLTARKFGPECAAAIASVMRKATVAAIDEMSGQFDTFMQDMRKQLLTCYKNLDVIAKQFLKDYASLNQTVNGKLKLTVDSLQKRPNQTIALDSGGVFFNPSPEGPGNCQKILDFADTVAHMNFMAYFDQGFQDLTSEFDSERKLYKKAIDDIVAVLRLFPMYTTDKMEKTFLEELEHQGLSNVAAFDAALKLSQETTRTLLQQECERLILVLQNDKTVEHTINKTSSQIQADFMDILSPYTSGNYGERILNRITDYHFFGPNVINAVNLTNFMTDYYLTDFETKLKSMLERNIGGKSVSADSHTNRMMLAMDKVKANGLGKNVTDKLLVQVNNASIVLDVNLGDERLLREWHNALDGVLDKLMESRRPIGVYHRLAEILDEASGDWVEQDKAETLETARQSEKTLSGLADWPERLDKSSVGATTE